MDLGNELTVEWLSRTLAEMEADAMALQQRTSNFFWNAERHYCLDSIRQKIGYIREWMNDELAQTK